METNRVRKVEAEILQCLGEAGKPISSVDVYEAIRRARGAEGKPVSPGGITSALCLLVRLGLIEQVERVGKGPGKAYYSPIKTPPELSEKK